MAQVDNNLYHESCSSYLKFEIVCPILSLSKPNNRHTKELLDNHKETVVDLGGLKKTQKTTHLKWKVSTGWLNKHPIDSHLFAIKFNFAQRRYQRYHSYFRVTHHASTLKMNTSNAKRLMLKFVRAMCDIRTNAPDVATHAD